MVVLILVKAALLNRSGRVQIWICIFAASLLAPIAPGEDQPDPSPDHPAFLEGLRQSAKSVALDTGVEVRSASRPRALRPVVSRFKGWYIDLTERARERERGASREVEGISLASKPAETSWWQFVETDGGWLVVATGGKYRGWVVARDDSAPTRPEGPDLTVAPALRLVEKITDNACWKLTLTDQGLVLAATAGKYRGWFWDFGGGDPSHEEAGREVAVNVLLAERVVAGSYFEVVEKPAADRP